MKKGVLLRISATACLFFLGFEAGRRLPLPDDSEGTVPSQSSDKGKKGSPDTHTIDISSIPIAKLSSQYTEWHSIPGRDIQSARNLKALARRWILESPSTILASAHRFDLLSEWARMDPHSLLAALEEWNDDQAFQQSFYTLSRTAPEAFLLFLEKREDLWSASKYDIPRAIQKLAKQNPSLAAEFLDRLQVSPDSTVSDRFQIGATTASSRSQFLHGVVAVQLSKDDPGAAIGWAQSLDSLELQQRALESILADLVLRSPAEAGDYYQQLSENSGAKLSDIVDLIVSEDPARGLLWGVEQATPGKAGDLLTSFCTELNDIRSIRRVYDQLDDPKLRNRFAGHLLMNWNHRSAEAGLEWVLSFPEENRAHWIGELGSGVGGSSFDTGWELAETIPDPELRENFERGLIRSLAENELERAIELAEQSGDPDLLKETLEWGYYMNVDDPTYSFEEVGEWLKQIEWSTYHNDVSTSLMKRWFDADPDGALAWFETLEGQTRQSVIYGLARSMKSLDTERAVEWASNLPSKEDRAAAIPAVLDSLAYGFPSRAFQLARKLDHTQLRMKEMQNAMAIWAKRDPEAAWKDLHASSTLSAKEIERLSVLFYGKR